MTENMAFSDLAERLARSDAPQELMKEVLARLGRLQEEVGGHVAAGAGKERFARLTALSNAIAAAHDVVVLAFPKTRTKQEWRPIH